MNIYDIAGNVWEWTMEHATNSSGYPCAIRGGSYTDDGSSYVASYRHPYTLTSSGAVTRFSSYYLLKYVLNTMCQDKKQLTSKMQNNRI